MAPFTQKLEPQAVPAWLRMSAGMERRSDMFLNLTNLALGTITNLGMVFFMLCTSLISALQKAFSVVVEGHSVILAFGRGWLLLPNSGV